MKIKSARLKGAGPSQGTIASAIIDKAIKEGVIAHGNKPRTSGAAVGRAKSSARPTTG